MPETWFFETLPLRPAPYPGESLSGYLLRLADLNGYRIFWDLASDLFPGWEVPQQIHKLSWEYPLEDWGRIPVRTGLSRDELSGTTVVAWVEKFRRPPDLHRSVYMSPGHFLHGVVNRELRVCPQCVQSQPYIRLLWRLSPVTACLEHGCLLEGRCPDCGNCLTPVSQNACHMQCTTCGRDFRSLPASRAPADLLKAQERLQEDVCLLLDPTATIAKADTSGDPPASQDPARALGLKFHYLRSRVGISMKSMARRVNLPPTVIACIEAGVPITLPNYMSYLRAIGLSWKDFAGLEVPDEFVQEIQTLRHAQLRICPNPHCSNHGLPSGTSVHLLGDLPGERIARFQCKVCGRRFTRSYDGELRAKPRRPSIRAGERPRLLKPPEEVARLIGMGTEGESNRSIADCLGWTERTVRIYWIALGLEERVHETQAKRRAKEMFERRSMLHSRIQGILEASLEQDREVTLRQVSLALGTNSDYLHGFPEQAEYARQMIERHNVRVRQKRDDAVFAKIAQGVEHMQHSDQVVKITEIASLAGISYEQLRDRYPELHRKVHAAIQRHRARLRKIQIGNWIGQIDLAAARLSAEGRRLNYHSILDEAGLSRHASKCAPIREALIRWVSNFAPRD